MGEASNSLGLNMMILFADADIFQRNTSMQQKQKAVAKVINGMMYDMVNRQTVCSYDKRDISRFSFLSRTPCSCPAERGLNQQNSLASLGP